MMAVRAFGVGSGIFQGESQQILNPEIVSQEVF